MLGQEGRGEVVESCKFSHQLGIALHDFPKEAVLEMQGEPHKQRAQAHHPN